MWRYWHLLPSQPSAITTVTVSSHWCSAWVCVCVCVEIRQRKKPRWSEGRVTSGCQGIQTAWPSAALLAQSHTHTHLHPFVGPLPPVGHLFTLHCICLWSHQPYLSCRSRYSYPSHLWVPSAVFILWTVLSLQSLEFYHCSYSANVASSTRCLTETGTVSLTTSIHALLFLYKLLFIWFNPSAILSELSGSNIFSHSQQKSSSSCRHTSESIIYSTYCIHFLNMLP